MLGVTVDDRSMVQTEVIVSEKRVHVDEGARGISSDLFDRGSTIVPYVTREWCDTSGPEVTVRLLQRITVTAVNDAKKCA